MINKYSIIVIDDNEIFLRKMQDLVKNATIILNDGYFNFFTFFTSDIKEFKSIISNKKLQNKIYFIDINLESRINGIDLAEEIREKDSKSAIIFFTNYPDYAFNTYQREIHALDYILKENNFESMQERITSLIQKGIESIEKEKITPLLTFTYKIGNRIFNVNLNNILYITTTSIPHQLKIVQKNGIGHFIGTIKEIQKKSTLLTPVSQSSIVNIKNINYVDTKKRKIYFSNMEKVKYSIRYSSFLKKLHHK